jgi:SSS family solute:Na+ symporter
VTERLAALDWAIVAGYFAAVFVVAWWVTRRRAGRDTSAGYFLASRDAGWFVIGASLFATNIGSEHLVGLAGSGAAGGVAVGQFEVLASLILLLLGWVFVPFYVASGVFTMPEFLERRYAPAARWYLAVVSIIAYVLTKISVTVAAGAIVFQALMGLDFLAGALLVVVATGAYTVLGGLRAVLYTDTFQMFVLVAGAVTVTAAGLARLGGWDEMVRIAGGGFMDMWRPASDPDFPWTGIVFGAPILGVWYWCTDQYIVQRVLAARGAGQARRGALFAGYLKLLPLFLFVVPGVVAHCLASTGRLALERPDQALPVLVTAVLPAGLRGVVVAGLIAALMSSLSSVFNSCSTLVTLDLYKKLHPSASERRLVWVGQLTTVLLVALALLWVPLMGRISGQLYKYLQSVQAYISPPIAAVFLLGILWRRANARGAVPALLVGFVLGALRLVAELQKDRLTGGWLHAYATMNFLHFAVLLFGVCTLVLVLLSWTGPAPAARQIAGLTFAPRPGRGDGSAAAAGGVASSGSRPTGEVGRWRCDAVASGVLVVLVLLVWRYFSDS